ncbi:MAG: hypothetical protein BRD23_06210 [Halobacteriales archaeon SW_9_67_25]|nr:MAG: hypothetical protein BRD23_06210 [Halobacteriales archaeon SW_9_67_25]
MSVGGLSLAVAVPGSDVGVGVGVLSPVPALPGQPASSAARRAPDSARTWRRFMPRYQLRG